MHFGGKDRVIVYVGLHSASACLALSSFASCKVFWCENSTWTMLELSIVDEYSLFTSDFWRPISSLMVSVCLFYQNESWVVHL